MMLIKIIRNYILLITLIKYNMELKTDNNINLNNIELLPDNNIN